jgi:outer membrane protein OmpA-like peptidoglycan-associated protein
MNITACRVLVNVVCCIAVVSAAAGQEGGQRQSSDEIIRSLGGGAVRGPQFPAPDAAAKRPPGTIEIPIEFESGSAIISASSKQQLDNVATALRSDQLREARIRIEGYTDDQGSVEFNQILSERRADAVRRYLIVQLGISSSRLEARGYGESRPLPGVDQSSERGRALNRRVVLVNAGHEAPPAADATQPLSVDVVVRYRDGEREIEVGPNSTLRSGDSYQVRLTPNQRSYVYVYQSDSTGRIEPLFPNAALTDASNPIARDTTITLPDATWMKLDQMRGREQIVVLAAPEAIADPKSIAFKVCESNPGGDTVRGPVMPAPASGGQGPADVFTYHLAFQHQ